jgi:outer membrane protein assembly factor BamB
VVGSSGDQRLHGYDGDTGAEVFAGGGPNELMAGTHTYSTTGIVARGRIYVATDNKVYAFRVGTGQEDQNLAYEDSAESDDLQPHQ